MLLEYEFMTKPRNPADPGSWWNCVYVRDVRTVPVSLTELWTRMHHTSDWLKPHSVRLHAQLSRAIVKARLGCLIGLLSSSQYKSAKGKLIYCWMPLR